MDIINNIAKLDYQAWKKSLNQYILYKYFMEQAQEQNKKLMIRLEQLNKIKERTEQQNNEYVNIVNQAIKNSSSIYEKVQENINNQELLKEIYSNKNIDLSRESYNRWLQTGEKMVL